METSQVAKAERQTKLLKQPNTATTPRPQYQSYDRALSICMAVTLRETTLKQK